MLAGVVVGLAPLAVWLFGFLAHSALRWALLAAMLAGAAAIPEATLARHVEGIYYADYVISMLFLATLFGRTLWAGHESSLCAQIARVAMGQQLDPDYAHYTWRVTAVWSVYFLGSAAVSTFLFFAASPADWSLFANGLTPVFVVLMFLGEFLIRRRVVPGRPAFALDAAIGAYESFVRGRRME